MPIGGILISVQAKLQPWVDETTKHQRQGIEEACKTFSTWKIISSSFELILRIHYETGWLATIVETSGLYHKHVTILIHDHNDSGLYYEPVIIYNPSQR